MSGDQADDIDVVEILSTVPVDVFKSNPAAYQWPKKNRCPVCLVGKFKHPKKSSMLVCKTCKMQLHIPNEA